ncbi:MAG: RNA-binding transcriptional accessory protein [Anaerolineales bacterium]|nr:RNA-binding transcriptional accessory protein [Anaerolineales bacterium]
MDQNTSHIEKISSHLSIRAKQVAATVALLDDDNTLPFIARYRKEATGGLDEEQIRLLSELLEKLRALDERREAVLKSIEEQGKLTPELRGEIEAAETLTALEDLYAPYKPKRRTRASIAREKGLQGLADWILQQPPPQLRYEVPDRYEVPEMPGTLLDEIARPFLNEQVPTVEEAWAGARDIVAEMISDHAEVRRITREKAMKWGTLKCEKVEDAADERAVYEMYYEFESGVERMRPHQVLAINRGEAEKVLRVGVQVPERDWRNAITAYFQPRQNSPLREQLEQAISDAAERLLLPAIERDVRRELTETADRHAITVFAANLRALLGQPPLAGHTVLGIDPGFRTGCKVAVVDATGKLLETATIYPHEPQKQRQKSLETLALLVKKHKVTLVTIGNGTASRETEALAAELCTLIAGTKSLTGLQYLIVNEAGASVYSASPLARAELPDLDVSLRGAASIARRAQDPLAELVKIDPKSIGVGMYQHDVEQKALGEALDGVVESVVNAVGVDVNTASPALLAHVAGIGPKLAEKIVAQRDEAGPFLSRAALRKVNGLGPKAFEQAAGFLRIRDGENPLDGSAIHPESYGVAERLLRKAGLGVESDLAERREALEILRMLEPMEALAAELGCGVPTLEDIFEQLIRPGRDPREDTPPPILRSDVLKMEDLVMGMRLKGTVRNVVDFGAFVDIGVKQDGLLHRSQIPRGTVLKVGDIIDVEIQRVEVERGRIGLGWGGKN